ncbi:MAG: hypothetical protein RJA44_68 [Pseudomonadota bacterium]
MTAAALLIIGSIAFLARFDIKPMLTPLIFGCGLIGGFVSIQQRIRLLSNEELDLLSRSWFQVLLIPIYGGIFSLVLHVGFLSGIITNSAFPAYYIPEFSNPPRPTDIIAFFADTAPKTGQDLAKLLFWSFISGFSERFVPQLLESKQPRPAQQP